MRQGRADIAEVNLPDFLGAEVADHLFGILAGELLAALEPRAAAQADADIGAVGDFQRPLVAFEITEDASRHAGQYGDRRIVGMNADAHAGFLGDRRHLFDEVGVVLPDLFLGENAPVRQRLLPGLAVPGAALVGAGHVEFAARCAADGGAPAAPDAVAHVRVGGVVDPRLAQIADVLLVLLHLLIAARQIERHLGHVVDAGVADVPHGDAGVGVALLDLHEALGGTQVGSRADTDVFRADLLEKEKLLVGRSGAGLRAELDAGSAGMHGGPGAAAKMPAGRQESRPMPFCLSLFDWSCLFSLPKVMPVGNRAGEHVSVHQHQQAHQNQ